MEKETETKLRMRLNTVLKPFALYGLDVYIPQAIEQIIVLIKLAETEGVK